MRRAILSLLVALSLSVPVSAQTIQVQSNAADLLTQSTGADIESNTQIAADRLDSLLTIAQAGVDPVVDQPSKTYGPQLICHGSAATPSAVSDDGDAQRVWCDEYGRLRLVSDTNIGLLATYLQPGSGKIIRSDNTDNDDKTEIKASAGVMLAISGRNSHASADAFVRCTNAGSGSTTPGSTAVIYEMVLPFGGGMVQGMLGPGGLTFDTALTCYIATGEAVTDNTDAAQDDVVVNVVYR